MLIADKFVYSSQQSLHTPYSQCRCGSFVHAEIITYLKNLGEGTKFYKSAFLSWLLRSSGYKTLCIRSFQYGIIAMFTKAISCQHSCVRKWYTRGSYIRLGPDATSIAFRLYSLLDHDWSYKNDQFKVINVHYCVVILLERRQRWVQKSHSLWSRRGYGSVQPAPY